MHHITAIDAAIIVLYLAGIIAFGVRVGRGQRSTRDYFLGGRNIPWWGVGLSIVATETSALTFISIPALAYGTDLAFLQILVGYVIARIILAAYLVPYYFRGEIYSPYVLLGSAFGEPARRAAGLFFLISGTLAAGVRVYVTCIPIQLMLGFREGEILYAILLFVGLSLVYTYLGGIKAVVWTDAAQFMLLLAGGLFAFFYLPARIDGGYTAIWETAGSAGKLHWLNLSPSLAMPYNLWMGLIGATCMAISTHGVDQLVVQRILACRDVREGRKSLLLSAAIILPLLGMFLLVGIFLWVYFQQNPPAMEVPEARPGVDKNDYVFPIFILTETPVAVRGLMIVAIISAAMSSVSSALSALASVSTMDFASRLFSGKWNEDRRLRFSRQATFFWAIILIGVAWLSQHTVSILNLAFSLNGLTNGAMLGGVLLALRRPAGGAGPVIAAMLTSLACLLLIHFGARTDFWQAHVGWSVAWPWYTLIGLAITLAVDRLVRGGGSLIGFGHRHQGEDNERPQ